MRILILHRLVHHLFSIQMSGLWILLVPFMSPNRELFYNLDELECGSVFMGNDQACEILGMDKIKLKSHDGIVCFLNEV